MSGLFDGVPDHIIQVPESLGAYTDYLETEKRMANFTGQHDALARLNSQDETLRLARLPQLTEQVRTIILTKLRQGVIPQTAAACAGIPARLWNDWMKQALQGLEPYATFYLECMQQEAESEAADTVAVDAKTRLTMRHNRPSLAENPLAVGGKWRKQTQQEITVNNVPAESGGRETRKLKPKERAEWIKGIVRDAAEQENYALDAEVLEDDE